MAIAMSGKLFLVMLCSVVGILFAIAIGIYFVGTPANESYKVVVVEYHPYKNNVSLNAENYINIIKSHKENLDLIVFPEATLLYSDNLELATNLPENDQEDLCVSKNDKYQSYLLDISCTAKELNINIVLNLVEREKCNVTDKDCPKSGFYFYNADAVFNRKGNLAAKYRKYNLFGEFDMTKPKVATAVKFTLDSIDFGIFTCFDILFQTPALNLTREMNVKNIIFPTMWFSELPFLTALQTQQMWSWENNVTLFSAGSANAKVGSGGSGLFVGPKGPIGYTFQSDDMAKVIKHDFKKENLIKGLQEEFQGPHEDTDYLANLMDNVKLKEDHLSDYVTEIIDTNLEEINKKLCHKDFCCNFDVKLNKNEDLLASNKNKYIYKFVAFSGTRSFVYIDGGVDICGIIACIDENTCTKRFPKYSDIVWPITFDSINITANFENVKNKIQFPNSLLSSIRPISPQHASWIKEEFDENTLKRTFTLNKSQNRLLTFSIFGRDFSRDKIRENVTHTQNLFV